MVSVEEKYWARVSVLLVVVIGMVKAEAVVVVSVAEVVTFKWRQIGWSACPVIILQMLP